MEDVTTKTKLSPLATVAETESKPRDGPVDTVANVECESHGDSCADKDAASASGSSTSDELLYLDESISASKATKENTTTSPFGRSVKRPPRAPVSPGDPEVEGVLPSQPSIIRRMQDTNKHYVDPKDARTLLPGVLFNSNSLDLDGVIDGMENTRVQESKIPDEVLLELLQRKELENLYLAQQRQQQELLLAASASGVNLDLLTALNERCRVSPPGFPQRQYQQEPQNNLLIQQMLNRPRHGRSVSDPTFAFADALSSMPPPFPQTAVDPVATTPIVDQADALAFLGMSPSQPQEWMPKDLQQPSMQPNLPGMLNISTTMQPELPKINPAAAQQRRRRHGRSESADFQNKNRYSGKDRGLPTSPSSGSKTFTRAEVKRMVQQQAALGRPTYAAWFRGDRAKNNKEAEVLMEMQPSHRRALSLPQVNTAPASPQEKQDPQNPTPKSGRAGTGVFFPRMHESK